MLKNISKIGLLLWLMTGVFVIVGKLSIAQTLAIMVYVLLVVITLLAIWKR